MGAVRRPMGLVGTRISGFARVVSLWQARAGRPRGGLLLADVVLINAIGMVSVRLPTSGDGLPPLGAPRWHTLFKDWVGSGTS